MRVIDLRENREEAICAAADALRSGLLAIFPTETVYGLFFTEKAKANAYALKGRDQGKPCAYHVGSFETLFAVAGEQSEEIISALKEKLPGSYTFLLPKDGGKVGVRYPSHKDVCEMLEKVGEPVFGTSANISGETPPTELSDTKALWEGVAVAVDGGSVRGVASEVVDLTGSEPRTIRKAE